MEVSLKMALQYNTNQGRKRPLVLALEHAYHGDTFKAMEVGDDEDYHFAFVQVAARPIITEKTRALITDMICGISNSKIMGFL